MLIHVEAAAFSPDNKYVLTGYSGGKKLLTLWDAASGKEVRSFAGHTDRGAGGAFVSGGKWVLSAGLYYGKVLLHDVATGKLLASIPVGTVTTVNGVTEASRRPVPTQAVVVQRPGFPRAPVYAFGGWKRPLAVAQGRAAAAARQAQPW